MFVICGLGMVALRRGPFGRRLQAMKDSPAACATLGIDLTRTKLAVFALSAGLAGLGGALLAGQKVSFDATTFDPTTSLVVLLMVVAGGVAMVSGALLGALLYASFDFWVQVVPSGVKELVNNLVIMAPGLIGISLARNPNGLAYQAVEGVRRRRETWARRRQREVEIAPPEPGWDLETLGVDRPFTAEDLVAIDSRLDTAELSGRWSA
jgi:ABC-type branched-subunit amino acid transport system permease subunit